MNILVNACIQWLVVSSATVVLLCSTSYEEITTEQSTTVVSQESVRQFARSLSTNTKLKPDIQAKQNSSIQKDISGLRKPSNEVNATFNDLKTLTLKSNPINTANVLASVKSQGLSSLRGSSVNGTSGAAVEFREASKNKSLYRGNVHDLAELNSTNESISGKPRNNEETDRLPAGTSSSSKNRTNVPLQEYPVVNRNKYPYRAKAADDDLKESEVVSEVVPMAKTNEGLSLIPTKISYIVTFGSCFYTLSLLKGRIM